MWCAEAMGIPEVSEGSRVMRYCKIDNSCLVEKVCGTRGLRSFV